MRKTKFQRVASFLLAFILLVGGGTLAVGAEDGQSNSSVTEKTIADYKEELDSISYDDYRKDFTTYEKAKKTIVVNACESLDETQTTLGWLTDAEWAELTAEDASVNKVANGIYKTKYDGVDAIYTPGTGSVTFAVDGVEPGLYSIRIVYYPVKGKAASIEREFYINGASPFKEARSLTLPKNWKNTYADGSFTVPKKKSADEYLDRAKDLGITATLNKKEDGTEEIIFKMPDVWTEEVSKFLIDEVGARFMTTDLDRNELRPAVNQEPEWSSIEVRDSEGYYAESFEFYLTPGDNGKVNLTLKGVNEPMAISEIILEPHKSAPTYKEYIAKYANAPAGKSVVKLEAEYPFKSSTNTVYPVEDRASAATSPADTSRMLLNTIGGEKWETAGQSLSYKFKVDSTGLYAIDMRFKQDVLDGLFVSRSLSLYSEGLAEGADGYYNGYPFQEAAQVRFNYSGYWQSTGMTDGSVDENGNPIDFQFYLVEGVEYTLKLEVTLGTMSEIISEIEASLNNINDDYLTIRRLTGTTPDDYRDYNFTRIMPGTLADMVSQSFKLEEVSDELKEITGSSSSTVATLVKVAKLLYKMHDEDEIARNLSTLKSYIGSVGTFLSDAKKQPLQLDYIVIQSAENELPTAEPGFFKKLAHEISSFFQSFIRDYNSMGAMVESEEQSLEVWVAYGRDQSQVIRNLITNDFTPNSQIPVDLKLVSGGTLLPSILAGMGPDVYLGIGHGEVINYAIRGALATLDVDSQGKVREDFEATTKNFTEAAMLVLGIANADNEMHYYALPETQSFSMLFVRIDILAELGIDIPKTWEDIYMAQTILEGNNMEIGLSTDYKIFLYQNGGELFADEGMRINLNSQEGLEAFTTMCNLFTLHSFPKDYDAANRFRSGEIPILVSDYTGMYNQLKVFATEIEGLWTFVPMPGVMDENGNINNCAISGVNADVIVAGSDREAQAWEYLKWYTGSDCQTAYANDMAAILGESAKHPTANREALASMPWNTSEFTEVEKQFNNLASVPNYPGSYYIDRYTNFAFLAAYNSGADPSSSLLSYINTINKEITRKRKEFKLETLDRVGELAADDSAFFASLAEKRGAQAVYALNLLAKEDESFKNLLTDAQNALADANIVNIQICSDDLLAMLASQNPDSYTVKVSRQDQETKDGGYKIGSLNKNQLIYFAGQCLADAAEALGTY